MTIGLFGCIGDYEESAPFSDNNAFILRDKIVASCGITLSDSIADFSELVLNIKEGRKVVLTIVADHDTIAGFSFFFITEDTVIRKSLGNKAALKVLMPVTAEISAPPAGFAFTVADTIVAEFKMSLQQGRKYLVTFMPGHPLSDPGDNHRFVRITSPEVSDMSGDRKLYTEILLLILLVIADIGFFLIMHLRNRYLKKKGILHPEQVTISNVRITEKLPSKTSSVHLFGGFEVYNGNGEEISSGFSPILKELFILLICRKPDEGISSASLKELLWFDKSEESARNNRSVYLAKLRQILETVGGYQLSNEKGKWLIDFTDIYVDYLDFRETIGKKIIRAEDIESLVTLVKKGAFLPECDYLWLDDVKAGIADYVITLLTDFSDHMDWERNPGLTNGIADALFTVDPLNDLALSLKCRYYTILGKPYLSKQIYSNYVKDYKSMYGEEYGKTYSDILSE
jgi:hypothetical protein